jgi:hypothetical protein
LNFHDELGHVKVAGIVEQVVEEPAEQFGIVFISEGEVARTSITSVENTQIQADGELAGVAGELKMDAPWKGILPILMPTRHTLRRK